MYVERKAEQGVLNIFYFVENSSKHNMRKHINESYGNQQKSSKSNMNWIFYEFCKIENFSKVIKFF